MLFCFLAGTRLPCWKFLIYNFSICSLQCFHVHLIKIIPKSVNLAPFWPKTGILNLWLWIILMFVILLFSWYKTSLLKISYLSILNMFFTMFSCTFNKNNAKIIKSLAPFWAKTGILNLWLWIMLMFVILIFGW